MIISERPITITEFLLQCTERQIADLKDSPHCYDEEEKEEENGE